MALRRALMARGVVCYLCVSSQVCLLKLFVVERGWRDEPWHRFMELAGFMGELWQWVMGPMAGLRWWIWQRVMEPTAGRGGSGSDWRSSWVAVSAAP